MENMIEKFNSRLNESVFGDDYNRKWAGYRASITRYITKSMWSNGSVVILGAGNLADVDLQQLCKVSSDITFADIDENAVRRGIERQKLKCELAIVKADLGMMDENNIIKNIHTFLEKNDVIGLSDFLNSYIFDDNMDVRNFDNVFVSALYTQLFIPQFMQMLDDSGCVDKEGMLKSALAFTARLIVYVNDIIMELAADDATVCVWSDVLEYSSKDLALNDILNHIEDADWMDRFYSAYIRDYGHGLGTYGIENITERLEEAAHEWFVWPFDDSRVLIVKMVSGIKG